MRGSQYHYRYPLSSTGQYRPQQLPRDWKSSTMGGMRQSMHRYADHS